VKGLRPRKEAILIEIACFLDGNCRAVKLGVFRLVIFVGEFLGAREPKLIDSLSGCNGSRRPAGTLTAGPRADWLDRR
jgi:hypothetical protein